MNNYLFTSESVTEGHPDKVCDQISDGILDAILAKDPTARVACESFCTTDRLVIMGEITTTAQVDYEAIARKVICDIGYDREELGFNGHTCDISIAVHTQSPDIAMGVDRSLELKAGQEDELNLHGAGDQGMMFGYACNETDELMPLSASLAHALSKKLAAVRKSGQLGYLRPDGKSQVTIEYKDGKPARVEAVVVSTQHDEGVDLATIRKDVTEQIIRPVIPAHLMDEHTKIFVNPTGNFVVGGPAGDTGLTGRKIIVDTYGGVARHGGGAFSGKDPTKVDRSAAYAARWVAKNVVAAGLADKCEVQLAYAIGVAKPVSVMVDTFGTAKVAEDAIEAAVNKVFDLRPEAIIRALSLRNPIYKQIAAYGHMGREELNLPWEQTNMVDALKAAV